MLAGRKSGQVGKLSSRLEGDAQRAEADGRKRYVLPDPSPAQTDAKPNQTRKPPETKMKYEARIDVLVDKDAGVYRDAKARLITLGLLGETAIDFTQGNESSGLAKDGEMFAGERVPDFGESISKMLDIVKPVAIEATGTLKELQTTAVNLSRITDEYSQLNMALAQMRTFAENLTSMTARDSSISLGFKNIENISTDLSSNDNLQMTLQNFRGASDKLRSMLADLSQLGPDLKESSQNVKELTATVKSQPWRLIWPSTIKPEEGRPSPGEATPVKKSPKPKRRPAPTPPPRTR